MSATITVRQSVPTASRILTDSPRDPDYVDSFVAELRLENEPSIDALTAAFFTSTPGWVRGLMEARNCIVRLAGLSTAPTPPPGTAPPSVRYAPGDRAVYFTVLERTEDEVVLGERDRHLDFRTALRKSRTPTGQLRLELTTVVWFHGASGRLYFGLVKPFHRLILGSMLGRFAAKQGSEVLPSTRRRRGAATAASGG